MNSSFGQIRKTLLSRTLLFCMNLDGGNLAIVKTSNSNTFINWGYLQHLWIRCECENEAIKLAICYANHFHPFHLPYLENTSHNTYHLINMVLLESVSYWIWYILKHLRFKIFKISKLLLYIIAILQDELTMNEPSLTLFRTIYIIYS